MMEKLMLLEQNNERLHTLLLEHFHQLEALYEGISAKYQQFHRSIAHMPIEERAMLLIELSRQTIELREQTEDRIQLFIQLLQTETVSAFAPMLVNALEHHPLKMFSKLHTL